MDGGHNRAAATEGAANPHRHKLFLASRSPRRQSLLAERGIRHTAAHPGVEDSVLVPGHVTPEQWVAALAYLKAVAGIEGQPVPSAECDWVLGADTACVADGRIIGTPESAEEAAAMLRTFSNATHEVVSGFALVCPRNGTRHIYADAATVHVGALSPAQIDDYVASGQWRGKAGGYNLSERIDAGWPITYVGDHTTIMGLPMSRLEDVLSRLSPGPPARETHN